MAARDYYRGGPSLVETRGEFRAALLRPVELSGQPPQDCRAWPPGSMTDILPRLTGDALGRRLLGGCEGRVHLAPYDSHDSLPVPRGPSQPIENSRRNLDSVGNLL